MQTSRGPELSHLIERLVEPELFDPTAMPVGRSYLHSEAKLAFDALASLAVLPITAAPTFVGGLAVKTIDRSPAIFSQERIGYRCEPFTIYKLTTMPGAPEHTHSNGRHDDPRRSRLGKLLSLLRVDESLQLANVASRDMSIIGPRPLLGSILDESRYVLGTKKHDEWIKVRSLALPGIFDEFSNMHHAYKLSEDEAEKWHQRVDLETAYILEKASFTEDARILGSTLALLGTTVARHTGRLVRSLKTKLSRFGTSND